MVILKNQPVVLLAGEEKFLKEESLSRIKSAFLDEASIDFNFNVFYAGATSAEKVLECACTAPFIGRKRVVVVYQFDDFSSSDKKFILSYVKSPHKHTLLILETDQTSLKHGPLAEISTYAQVILCNPYQGQKLNTWLKRQVASYGKKIDDGALKLLIDNIGDNLSVLKNYLETIILYVGKRKSVEVSDVEKLTGPDVRSDAFKLFDALRAQNKQRALGILDSLLKEGVVSSQILGGLTYKVIVEKRALGASLFAGVLKELQRADSDIKRGRQDQRLALELLMIRLLTLF